MDWEERETNRAKVKDRECSRRAEMGRKNGREGQRKEEMGRQKGKKLHKYLDQGEGRSGLEVSRTVLVQIANHTRK